MKKRNINIILLVLLLIIAGWYLQDVVLTSGYAPSKRPEFIFSPPLEPGEVRILPEPSNEPEIMLIKNLDPTGKVVLFKAGENPQFFRYDPAKGVIETVDSKEWDESREKELDCWEQSTPDVYSGPSYGQYILVAKRSPDNSKIAVLSAYGPKSPISGFIFGGGGKIFGTRYLEIRNVADNESIRRPVRIDISDNALKPSLCWSDGASHIIVHDLHRLTSDRFSIVDN